MKRKVKATNPSFRPPLGPPERPERPGIYPTWPYPPLIPNEDTRKILREILTRLESIENRLDRIEKLLIEKK